MKRLLSFVRRAVDDYEMIEEGDRIAVGISGGKDSLTLLEALSEMRRFYPKKYDIVAITVDMGFPESDMQHWTFDKQDQDCQYTDGAWELWRGTMATRTPVCAKRLYGNENWGDYAVSVQVKPQNGINCGLLVRATNPGAPRSYRSSSKPIIGILMRWQMLSMQL